MTDTVKFEIHFDIEQPRTTASASSTTTPNKKLSMGGAPQDLQEQAQFHQTHRGGIYGGPVEDKIIGFRGGFNRKDASQIRGGVIQSKFRDERSAQAVVLEKYYIRMEALERKIGILESLANMKGKFEKISGNLKSGVDLLNDPVGFGVQVARGTLEKIGSPKKMNQTNKNALNKNLPTVAASLPANQNQQRNIARTVMSMASGAGPYGLAFVGAVSAIAAAPETVAKIIRLLGQKGLPLNMDWRRIIEDEANALFSIQQKRDYLLGRDSFIVTANNRYQADTGAPVYNSLENRDEIRISTAGNRNKALGVE